MSKQSHIQDCTPRMPTDILDTIRALHLGSPRQDFYQACTLIAELSSCKIWLKDAVGDIKEQTLCCSHYDLELSRSGDSEEVEFFPGQDVIRVCAVRPFREPQPDLRPSYTAFTVGEVRKPGYFVVWLLEYAKFGLVYSPERPPGHNNDDDDVPFDEDGDPILKPRARFGEMLSFPRCSVALVHGNPFDERRAEVELREDSGFDIERVRKPPHGNIEPISQRLGST